MLRLESVPGGQELLIEYNEWYVAVRLLRESEVSLNGSGSLSAGDAAAIVHIGSTPVDVHRLQCAAWRAHEALRASGKNHVARGGTTARSGEVDKALLFLASVSGLCSV